MTQCCMVRLLCEAAQQKSIFAADRQLSLLAQWGLLLGKCKYMCDFKYLEKEHELLSFSSYCVLQRRIIWSLWPKKRKQNRPRQAVIKTVWSLNNTETSSLENTGRDCQPRGNMTVFNPADNRSAGRAHWRLRHVWLKQRGMWFGVKVLISWSLSLSLLLSCFLFSVRNPPDATVTSSCLVLQKYAQQLCTGSFHKAKCCLCLSVSWCICSIHDAVGREVIYKPHSWWLDAQFH